ncbi:MAG: type II CAAX endopeptidase family protein [Steroidobacteraceae bacterium]|nr:type II CAAX endopeptidase family protein [Steroidobacteraceae bacterium]
MSEHVVTAEARTGMGSSRTLEIFLILVLVGSAILNYMVVQAGGVSHAMGLVFAIMWVPGLAAIAALMLARRPLADIGWRLGPARIIGAAIILPAVIVTPIYAVLWLGGLADLNTAAWSKLVEENLGWRLAAAPSVLVLASIGLMVDTVAAMGEEIGWRGLLLPELGRRMSWPAAALVTGAIWAVWHYPGILYGGYASSSTPIWFSLVSFTIMLVGWSMVLAWTRLASGSFWPAALMHGAHNITIQAILNPATKDASGLTAFVSGEFGLGVAFAYLIAGVIAWRAIARRQPARPGS